MHGAEINLQSGVGVAALMLAADKGHERVVELLLRHGAEVDLQDSGGGTALMSAATNSHERVVELLIRHGAEINLQQRGGLTALMGAAADGHLPNLLRLLAAEDVRLALQTAGPRCRSPWRRRPGC